MSTAVAAVWRRQWTCVNLLPRAKLAQKRVVGVGHGEELQELGFDVPSLRVLAVLAVQPRELRSGAKPAIRAVLDRQVATVFSRAL